MKIWTNLKVSIAGARLSHLVQKDKIWDHGSMTEQVKNLFYRVEKAKAKGNTNSIEKYMTTKAYEQLIEMIKKQQASSSGLTNVILTEVWIIDASVKSKKNPDRFIALIKGKSKKNRSEKLQLTKGKDENFGIKNLSQRWYFIRHGEWWLLDSFSK